MHRHGGNIERAVDKTIIKSRERPHTHKNAAHEEDHIEITVFINFFEAMTVHQGKIKTNNYHRQ